MSNAEVSASQRLGALIRHARETAHATQTDLADWMSEELGAPLHKSVISKIEAGTRSLSFREAVAIARFLPVSLAELGATIKEQSPSEMWEDLLDQFRGMAGDLKGQGERLSGAILTLRQIEEETQAALDDMEDWAEADHPIVEDRKHRLEMVKRISYTLNDFRSTLLAVGGELGTIGKLPPFSALPESRPYRDFPPVPMEEVEANIRDYYGRKKQRAEQTRQFWEVHGPRDERGSNGEG